MALEKRVLALIGELVDLLDLHEFCEGLLHALRETVPSDWCAINEVPADLPHTVSLTDPPVPSEIHDAFARYGSQNPIVAHFMSTGDGRATRFSDLITRRQLHRLELSRHVYRPLNTEYQIAFTLTSGSVRILGVALSRAGRDFTARERDLLNLARPYLIQMYRRHRPENRSETPRAMLPDAQRHEPLRTLTTRVGSRRPNPPASANRPPGLTQPRRASKAPSPPTTNPRWIKAGSLPAGQTR